MEINAAVAKITRFTDGSYLMNAPYLPVYLYLLPFLFYMIIIILYTDFYNRQYKHSPAKIEQGQVSHKIRESLFGFLDYANVY